MLLLIGTGSVIGQTTTKTSDDSVIEPTTLNGVEGLFFDIDTARRNLADLEHYDWLLDVHIPALEQEALLAYDIAEDANETARSAIEAMEQRDRRIALWRTGTYVSVSVAAVTTTILLLTR